VGPLRPGLLLPVLQSRTEAGLSLSGKIFGLVLDWLVGYGYRPSRAFGWLAVLLVAGSMYFTINQPTPLNSEHLQRRASRPGPHPIGGLAPIRAAGPPGQAAGPGCCGARWRACRCRRGSCP